MKAWAARRILVTHVSLRAGIRFEQERMRRGPEEVREEALKRRQPIRKPNQKGCGAEEVPADSEAKLVSSTRTVWRVRSSLRRQLWFTQ